MRALAQAVRLALTLPGCRAASSMAAEGCGAGAISSDGRPING
jgi:hypothetical protein